MKKAPFLALLLAASAAVLQATAQTPPAVEIKKANVTPEQAAEIQKILADAKPDSYSFTYARGGKTITRAGSASFRQLSTVKAYTRGGAGDTKSINEALTTIDNYVKTILTTGFNRMYPEKVRQINAILEKSAAMR